MKTEWDYTELAHAYLKRPNYSSDALRELQSLTNTRVGEKVCDIGAGVAHLTLELARLGFHVTAIEPNDAMRANGIKRTQGHKNIEWVEASAEHTTQAADSFALVTFGSSFNVTNQPLALREAARILRQRGWFACMWNHRDLSDPLQMDIEETIKRNIKQYTYGSRREDQTSTLNQCELFGSVHKIEGRITHTILKRDFIEAWRSHATLHRQAGGNFESIIRQIEDLLDIRASSVISVPYVTRIWAAQYQQ